MYHVVPDLYIGYQYLNLDCILTSPLVVSYTMYPSFKCDSTLFGHVFSYYLLIAIEFV